MTGGVMAQVVWVVIGVAWTIWLANRPGTFTDTMIAMGGTVGMFLVVAQVFL